MNVSNHDIERISKLTKKTYFFLVILMFFQFLGLFLLVWKDWGILNVAWNIYDRSLNTFGITAVRIDANNQPWFIRQLFGSSYELHHGIENRKNVWDLSFLTFEDANFASIAEDKSGNPWLILGERLAHWNGSEWKFIPTPFDADIKDFICPTVVVKNFIVWGLDNATEGKRIIKLDLREEQIQSQEIALPADLVSPESKFECIVSVGENDLLAVLSDEAQVGFYRLQDLEWHKITSFENEHTHGPLINDVFVNSKGEIWVVTKYWLEDRHVGKFDPIKNSWIWFDVEVGPENSDRYVHIEYNYLAVDGAGRIWISGTKYKNHLNTPMVGVFLETPDGVLKQVLEYTEDNSQVDTSLLSRVLITEDQKIWTWYKQLVWIDSGQQVLPPPLPNWFVVLSDNNTKLFLGYFNVLLLGVILYLSIQIKKVKTNKKI